MKKILITLTGIVLSLSNIKAQTNTLDAMLVNIDLSPVTSGIIYERALPFANLYNYNQSYDTATLGYFEQAFHELYRASNQLQFMPYTNLRQLYTSEDQSNIIDIGMINTQFSILNYNENNPYAGGLILSGDQFYPIEGQPAFYELHKLIIAPLRLNAVGESFTFNFRSDLLFSNGTKTVTNLSVDLGDGVERVIITNSAITTNTITINYNGTGNKVLRFTATFNDASTITTYGKLFVKVIPPYTTLGLDPLIEDGSISPVNNPHSFQGYNETSPITGQLNYRIFYHTNNGNNQATLLKPIIISDGFDPDDIRKIQSSDYIEYREGIDRSIEDMMRYKDCNGNPKDLITILREKGYDVVVVNYPNYTAANGQKIDGGADYIERNAMNMIALIQMLKSRLDITGSPEQLVVVGPSMGGQISRYALAYMEKKYAETGDMQWSHRTRLWVSIDSPHLGANIPYGAQSLVYQLKDDAPKAEDFYINWLGSPAAKQQLIELHTPDYSPANLNGGTISQGFSTNSGSPFYQQYYNNLFNNGLPNSKGYPVNLRKISLVNGSVTGKKTASLNGSLIGDFGNSGDQRLNVRGFIQTLWWDNYVAALEGYNMPSYGNSSMISRKFRFLGTGLGYNQTAANLNTRGNMDIVPGGYFPTWDLLNSAIVDTNVYAIWNSGWPSFETGKINFETRTNAHVSSFIPSFSALGINNPDQDWAQPLNRNLVCSNEIPFDSYFGYDDNTQHTSFDCESVTWLLKELDGLPQVPWYPLSGADINGLEILCLGSNTNYSFANNCAIPSDAVWTVSPNLQIINSTPSSVTVSGVSNGNGTITATFSNGKNVTRNIVVGTGNSINYTQKEITCLNAKPYFYGAVQSVPFATNYAWYSKDESNLNNPFILRQSMLSTTADFPLGNNRGNRYYTIRVIVTNPCGTSQSINEDGYLYAPDCTNEDGLRMSISPNPTTGDLQIETTDETTSIQEIQVADKLNNLKKKIKLGANIKKQKINISELPADVYIIRIYDGKTWVSKKVIKN